MLVALQTSNEDPALVNIAKNYLSGILSSNAQKERDKALQVHFARAQMGATLASPRPEVGHQVVDLTGGSNAFSD
jgi:hypothetical protein